MECNISVVIATYQRHVLLSTCIEALASQSYSDPFEVVVISDGPDDRLVALSETWKLPPNVRLVLLSNERKSGPAAARNLGWRSSHGELVVFTDDDCIADTNLLTSYWNYYLDNGRKNICMKGTVVVPVSPSPSDYERNVSWLQVAELVTANCAVTRDVLKMIGGFDERYKMAWREDSDLHFAILDHNIPVDSVVSAVIVHPVRKAPWGISIFDEKKNQFNALLRAKYPQYYKVRVNARPPAHYYAAAASVCMSAIAFAGSAIWISGVFFGAWLLLSVRFALIRLKGTRKTASHIAEMLITSGVIPVLSLFWALYGFIRFRNVSYEARRI
jgi:glycosyltransferase involved in cell wall biosynthesis